VVLVKVGKRGLSRGTAHLAVAEQIGRRAGKRTIVGLDSYPAAAENPLGAIARRRDGKTERQSLEHLHLDSAARCEWVEQQPELTQKVGGRRHRSMPLHPGEIGKMSEGATFDSSAGESQSGIRPPLEHTWPYVSEQALDRVGRGRPLRRADQPSDRLSERRRRLIGTRIECDRSHRYGRPGGDRFERPADLD
jgi:hypothetical protein